jgi:hypothetical protein
MDHRIVCPLLSPTRLGIEGAGIERKQTSPCVEGSIGYMLGPGDG